MNCREVKENWKAYLEGSLPPEREQEITAHLEDCPACRELLSGELGREAPVKPDGPAAALDEKQQRKILRAAKWKNRISNLVFAAAVFALVSVVSGVLTSLWFGSGEPSRMDNAKRTWELITEMTMPNVQLASGGINSGWYFTTEGRADLEKRIGRENRPVGTLETRMFFNRLNVHRNWTDEYYSSHLFFIHPGQTERLQDHDLDFYSASAWETLAKLPEGTVAEMALSFDRLYTIDETLVLFRDYDLDVVWFAVDTGVEDAVDHPLGALWNSWGFSNFGPSALDYEWPLEMHGDGDKRAKAFLDGMEFLLQHEKWARSAYHGMNADLRLAERYAHLSENGVRLYGAVVTGPTPELLKLKDDERIRAAGVGEAALWNWSPRPYHSTMR